MTIREIVEEAYTEGTPRDELIEKLEAREAIMIFPGVTEANRLDAPLTD
jgi:hypothetical protein